MTPPAVDISAVITGHREGRLSVASLRSLRRAADQARAQGLRVEELYVLDRANALTTRLFRQFAEDGTAGARCLEVDVGDQGEARNLAVAAAHGTAIAFLDGDDLWTEDWLSRAWAALQAAPELTVIHPQFNYFFDGQKSVFEQISQDDPRFSPDLLRLVNYWDALAMAPTALYRDIPFPPRDMENGWAYEDWAWNCLTVEAGVKHKVLPGTVIFKRRRRGSQTMQASQGKARMRRVPLMSYSHAAYDVKPPE